MKRGWCPTLYDPMPTGDGLLVRVKPRGARLTATAMHHLAHASLHFGNGIVEVTRRANLQVRGFTEATAPAFATAMVAAGLASPDAGAERRRNVIASPLAGDDPGCSAAAALATAIEAMLESEPSLPELPPKFGFSVDGGGILPMPDAADVELRTDGIQHWIALGGAQTRCARDATVAIVRELARIAGAQRIRERSAEALLAAVGLAADPVPPRAAEKIPIGFLRYSDGIHGAFGIGLPFGQAGAATLETLAGLAETFGDGTLRTTPWRALLLGRVDAADIHALTDAAGAAGLIVSQSDRRLRMAACIGSAGCASGTVRARDDAALPANADWAGFLHASGCAKGCAHPAAASVTLVGDAGAYNLIRHGRANAEPGATALSRNAAAAWLRSVG